MDISEDVISMLQNSIDCDYSDFFVIRADDIMKNNNFNNLINLICLRYGETIIHSHDSKTCIFQINELYFKMYIGNTRDDSYSINVFRYDYLPV